MLARLVWFAELSESQIILRKESRNPSWVLVLILSSIVFAILTQLDTELAAADSIWTDHHRDWPTDYNQTLGIQVRTDEGGYGWPELSCGADDVQMSTKSKSAALASWLVTESHAHTHPPLGVSTIYASLQWWWVPVSICCWAVVGRRGGGGRGS